MCYRDIDYSEDNPFCCQGKVIQQFKGEALCWELEIGKKWITEWRELRRLNMPAKPPNYKNDK